MIVMMIADTPEAERKRLLVCAKSQAARYTDEYWDYLESDSVEELLAHARRQSHADLVCVDLTMQNALEAAESIRETFPQTFLILIADETLSPARYLRPSIRAESLMIKPLGDEQMDRVLGEAVSTYVRRIETPDEKEVFLVENRGDRNLIEYRKILFFEAREKKIFLSTETEEYGFYATMEELSEKLGAQFIRCHRSFLINRDRIGKIELSKSRIILDDGTEVPLSRSYKPDMRRFLEDKDRKNAVGAHGDN